tara:strand:+ start:12057 stop:14186 length:2130 start_codon:yes stop_codon:yes gene_type:complete
MIGSDVLNSQQDIISKLQGILSILDISEQRKKRNNLNQWKTLFSDLRATFGDGIEHNPIALMLVLIKLTKAKSTKNYNSEDAEEKANMRSREKKQKRSEKQQERSSKRAQRKQNRRETLKHINNSMDNEYSRILGTIIKQAISNVLPKIPGIIVDEILRSFNCDLSTEIPVVGDGLNNSIVIRVDQVDLFSQLKNVPDVGVGKYCYEANPFDLGVYPPGQTPFPLNRFLHYLTQNANTPLQVYGQSGNVLFTVEYDGVDSFVISPHYKGPTPADNQTVYDNSNPSPGGLVKFTVAEFLRDYFDNIRVVELQGLLGALLEIQSGLGMSFSNDGPRNFADIMGVNKLIGILNKIMASCDGMDLGKISTDSVSHLSELLDSDDFFTFNVEEEQNFYLEAKRKSKGVIKFESCDNIEIPLDPAIFESAADDIVASLNSGGDGLKAFSTILQTGVAGSIAKMPDDAYKELDWNWSVHFMEKLIIQFPVVMVLGLMSTKVILPIVLVAIIVNNQTLLAANPAEFAKLFKRVFFRICRAILNEVIKIAFKILKQFLIKLLIVYVKMLLSTQKGKRIKMILSLIQALLPFIDDLQNAQNCKEILSIILKMIDATGIDIPFRPPNKFLQFAAVTRSGTNSIRTFQKLIIKLEALGIHTGDMPDGSENKSILGKFAEIEAMEEEKTIHGVVHSVLYPTIAKGPPGAVLVEPTKCIGVTC